MPNTLLQGNEAISHGALRAGMNFFAGYPITPASEILELLSKRRSIKVMQMEDEIASINVLVGASLAGSKAMTATSGPGLSLMQEGIGLAHMMQVPMVIVDVQRVGPSTGMPTLPAQGDIMASIYGSHGDYFPFVFYPNSVEELYRYTIEAFNASEDSLSPVMLLSDGYLSHLYETVNVEEIRVRIRPRKVKPLGGGRRHFTGLTAKDNIPRTTSPVVHTSLMNHLKRKQENAGSRYRFYEYMRNDSSNTLVICFGALSRAIYRFKDRFSIFRPITISPILEEELCQAAGEHERIIVAEMNAGQYAKLVESAIQRKVRILSILGGELDLNAIGGKLKWIIQHG